MLRIRALDFPGAGVSMRPPRNAGECHVEQEIHS